MVLFEGKISRIVLEDLANVLGKTRPRIFNRYVWSMLYPNMSIRQTDKK